LPLLGRPTDEAVPILTLPGRCPEDRTGHGAPLSIANDVLQIFPDRSPKAQVMKLGQCAFDPSPPGWLPADFFHAQGSQLGQSASDRLDGATQTLCGFGPAAHPIGRRLPSRRQFNQAPLV